MPDPLTREQVAEDIAVLRERYEGLTSTDAIRIVQLCATVEAQAAELERLRRGAAEDDKGLDRWCHYQDRLIAVLDDLGVREAVTAGLERDGWRNEPECRHKSTVEAQAEVIARYRDGWEPSLVDRTVWLDCTPGLRRDAVLMPEAHQLVLWGEVVREERDG